MVSEEGREEGRERGRKEGKSAICSEFLSCSDCCGKVKSRPDASDAVLNPEGVEAELLDGSSEAAEELRGRKPFRRRLVKGG